MELKHGTITRFQFSAFLDITESRITNLKLTHRVILFATNLLSNSFFIYLAGFDSTEIFKKASDI